MKTDHGFEVLAALILCIVAIPASIIGGVGFAAFIIVLCIKELVLECANWFVGLGGPDDTFA